MLDLEKIRDAVACLQVEAAEATAVPVDAVPTGAEPLLRRLEDGLAVGYVVEEGDVLEPVLLRDLAAAGLSPDELHALAIENLRQRIHGNLNAREYGPIWAVFGDVCFEASLLLLDEIWEDELAALVDSGFAVAIPARDVLAFCDADSLEGIAELRALVDQVSADCEYPLTKELYRRCEGRWERIAAS